MIRINNITTSGRVNHTADKPILKNFSYTFRTRSITTLIGKSGVGKSTLLRCIAGLQAIDQGSIYLQNQNLQELSKQQRAGLIGFVFQSFNLFPHMNVLDNCMLPLTIVQKMSKKNALSKTLDILTLLGMENYQGSYPSQLSGGQQQRIAIARALLLGPKVLLLDEPSSALDPTNTKILIDLLQTLSNEGLTLILASHDMEFVRALPGSVGTVENGQIT